LRNQLELLFKVQTIDNNVKNSIKLQKRYQNDILRLEEKVKKEEEQYIKQQEIIENFEKEHRNSERALSLLEEKKKKIEDKLMSIKTNKEYQASLQEIEKVKEVIKKQEDETIENLDSIESAKKDIKKLEEEYKKTKAQFEEKKKQVEKELKCHLDEIEQQKEKRELLVTEIDPDVFTDYKRIQKVRQGCAVAIAMNEHCMECSMKIPPQIYNEVVYAEKIKTCPYCNRILYVKYENDNK